MKVLIAYDDSDCSKAALDDLKNAGLPEDTEVLILTVIENLSLIFENEGNGTEQPVSETIRQMRNKAHTTLEETKKNIASVAEKLQKDFPSWTIQHKVMLGFAHWGVLEKAREWKPDLIVVGSHGRNLIGRVLLGSSSLKILSEALCSVRVARCSPARTKDDTAPQRIIIAFDASPDSVEAVEAVVGREWQPNTAVRLVTAIEPVFITSPGLDVDLNMIDEACHSAADKLKAAGLHVSTETQVADAKKLLIEEAEQWGADAIFIGAKGHNFVERVLLGSVSYAIAARAECTVEVIRRQNSN